MPFRPPRELKHSGTRPSWPCSAQPRVYNVSVLSFINMRKGIDFEIDQLQCFKLTVARLHHTLHNQVNIHTQSYQAYSSIQNYCSVSRAKWSHLNVYETIDKRCDREWTIKISFILLSELIILLLTRPFSHTVMTHVFQNTSESNFAMNVCCSTLHSRSQ